MKYSDLPVKSVENIKHNQTFIVCSDIITNEEDNKIEKIDKCLVDAANFASKEEVIALTEQNSKLVKIISQMMTKQTEIDKTLAEIKTLLKSKEDISLESIQEQIDLLEERLENNIVEL